MSRKIKKNKKSKKRSSAQDFPKSKKHAPAPQPQPASLSVDQAFQLAVQNFQAGNLQQAELLCLQMLNVDPDNFQANHLLGVILAQQGGKNESAVQYIRKAIQVNPNNAEAHNNLGNIFQVLGRTDEAVACYKKALSINPDHVDAHFKLGVIFQESGRLGEAVTCFRQALSVKPDYAAAYNNLGIIFNQSGKQKESIASYRRALSINPGYAEAYNNLGVVLKVSGRLEEAVASFRQALSISSNYAAAHNNLGLAFRGLGRYEEAAASYRQALLLQPDYVSAHNNLGIVLQKLGKFKDAIASFRKALSLKPDYAEAYNNLGVALKITGRIDEAIGSFKKALSLKPDYSIVHSNLLFNLNYSPNITQKDIFSESLRFARMNTVNENFTEYFPAKRDTAIRRLKVGYVSPDFREHSVAFFIKPLLKAHNRERFEIYCYSDVMTPDTVTEQIKKESDHWITIAGKNDADSIAQIKNDRIDILIDLAGYTDNNRLLMFAQKPAPVQVSWLGYPNTTGIRAIDYRFTDRVADPVGDGDALYSEELIRLQDGFLCYEPYEHAPDVSAPPCLVNDTVTFGSFNNLAKVTPEVVKVWAEILLRVPDSRFILKSRQLSDKSFGNDFMETFAKEGVFTDRVEILGLTLEMTDHLAAYNTIDIALDPFPYNGTTTTCEALWMGVPVVALQGDRHSGRVGASLLHAIGMTETLVADSTGSYVELAVSLTEDKELLINLRKDLRQQMKTSPLCDSISFAKKIEEAYQVMWAKYAENYGKEERQETELK